MRLFFKPRPHSAVLLLLTACALGIAEVPTTSAAMLNFTPDSPADGTTSLNTTVSVLGDPLGGTLTFDLTLGANYSLGANSGANGYLTMELDTASTPFWSFAVLTAAPSTPGSTTFSGDWGNGGIFSPANLTDTTIWSVDVAPGDFPASLMIASSFSGFCSDPSACYTPNATFSYDFVPNVSATPVPAALPLFGTGMGVLAWFVFRKRRRFAF